MASEDDQASDTEDFFRSIHIRAALSAPSDVPPASNKCLYCDHVFSKEERVKGKRWCDSYCRDDWQAEENAKRRASGRPVLNSGDLQRME